MATFENFTGLLSGSSDVAASSTAATTAADVFPIASVTLSPGHAAILEMHANSRSNAIMYIGVVLLLYVLGMAIVLIKYIRSERYEARLTRLFQDLVQRDRFFRVSRRRSSVPKNTPEPSAVKDDSPTFVFQVNGDIQVESRL